MKTTTTSPSAFSRAQGERPGDRHAGVAERPEDDSADALVKRADAALMDGKRSGQATVRYTPPLADVDSDVAVGHSPHATAHHAARAVDGKDSYTRGHCETVAALCQAIATELGVDCRSVAAIRLAGLVHDVGKIGVPDAILEKPGKLTQEEFEVIKGHSALGHKILIGTELEQQAPCVLDHHERVDGRGYPGRLVGGEIPLDARIIHLADAFEAMTWDRPYRHGMSDEDASAELIRHIGTQFDSDCV